MALKVLVSIWSETCGERRGSRARLDRGYPAIDASGSRVVAEVRELTLGSTEFQLAFIGFFVKRCEKFSPL